MVRRNDSEPQIAKKARNEVKTEPTDRNRCTPEDFEPGTAVLYWGAWRGKIHDTFAPLDKFFICDDESGTLVRNRDGTVVEFKADDLVAVAATPEVLPQLEAVDQDPASGVLIIGSEAHMVRILEHFGPPSTEERLTPQQLLAIPCDMCDPHQLLQAASEGIGEEIMQLGQSLRRDSHVAIRVFFLKQAVEQLGPDVLRIERHFCLSAVNLPFDQASIKASGSRSQKHQRQKVWNQVDLCVTAVGDYPGEYTDSEASQQALARRALGETCGLEVADVLWEPKVQSGIRRRLGVDLRLKFVDPLGALITVLILPDDAEVAIVRGVLCFGGAPGVDYTKEPLGAADGPQEAPATTATQARQADPTTEGKTIGQWEKEQESIDGPKLPPYWLRIKSRTGGEVYFFNKKTEEATFELPEWPLPPGWTKQVSKSTGKTYYFNAGAGQSTFVRPQR